MSAKFFNGSTGNFVKMIKANKAIVLEAVIQDGESLKHASSQLKGDKDVIL